MICKKKGFPATYAFPTENTLSCKEMRFPAEKYAFVLTNAWAYIRKPQETLEEFQGSRIKNVILYKHKSESLRIANPASGKTVSNSGNCVKRRPCKVELANFNQPDVIAMVIRYWHCPMLALSPGRKLFLIDSKTMDQNGCHA